MSERKITVSDGTNFYLIPVSDLDDACADGFYIPALRDRTIVSNGHEIFEIPVADLSDAAADGFYDVLAVERELAMSFATSEATMSSSESTASQFQEVASPKSSVPAKSTIRSKKSVLLEDNAGDTDSSDTEPIPTDLQTEDDAPQGPLTLKSRLLQLLHPTAAQRRSMGVLATNAAVHAGIIFLLAAIFLPSIQKEEFMMITSTFEPETAQTEQLEMMELDQPIELSEDTPPAETFVDSQVESMDLVDVNINDLDLASVTTSVDLTSKVASAISASEFGGRSKAGRSAMVAKMGGNAASEKAVHLGLTWMARHQSPDGGWSYDHTGGECNGSCSQPGSLGGDCRNAATGMAILALLGAGNTPFEGDFQESVLNGVKYLLAHSQASPAGLDLRGQHDNNTGMYTHAIAATALCETLAMLKHELKEFRGQEDERDNNKQRVAMIRQLEPAVQASINFISNAQSKKNGSWGYNPGTDGDTSILGWQIMALKSAVHADISVNPATVRGANVFLNEVQADNGMYGYRSNKDTKESTTAIGLVCRMLSGMSREEPRLKMAVETLSAKGPIRGNMYYNYYATQVMLHYGGEKWTKWNAVMRDQLVSTQKTDGHAAGSWDLSDTHGARAGRLYMTCLCTMTLEVYYRHLPLYGIPKEADSDEGNAEPKSDKKLSSSK